MKRVESCVALLMALSMSSVPARAQDGALPPGPPPAVSPPPMPPNSMAPADDMEPVGSPYRISHHRRPKRRGIGLLIAGGTTLVLSYAFTALVGLKLLSGEVTPSGGTCLNCDSVGTALLIPVAGPWIALPNANAASGGQVITAILGVAQAAGLGLTVAGIVLFATSGQPSNDEAPPLSFQLTPLPGGAFAGVRGIIPF